MTMNATLVQVDECCNDECCKPIYEGQQVWKHGADRYCTLKCLANGIGLQVGVDHECHRS